MIHIEKLRLRLPAGFEQRASGIANKVGEKLADMPAPHDGRIETINICCPETTPEQSDDEIVNLIAQQLRNRLEASL